MIKRGDLFLAGFFLIYSVAVCVFVFFSNSDLNKTLSTKLGFAQFYSFSTLFGVIVLSISIIIIAVIFYKNSLKLKNSLTNIILLCTAVVSILFIIGGTNSGKLTTIDVDSQIIKIVEWNAANNINESDINDIFGKFDADIAVFPELEGYEKGDTSNKRLSDLFKKANIDFDKYEAFVSMPTEGNIAPVTIVIKKEFGEYNVYKEIPMTRFGTVYLSSTSINNPNIIGVHAAPPLIGLMNIWKRDLKLISDIAYGNKDSIIIGDFNATMKHGYLNDINTHMDVLEYASKNNTGTWHRDIPAIFRTTIDHVLIPNNTYSVKSVETKNYTNSDHLCVFVVIQENERGGM